MATQSLADVKAHLSRLIAQVSGQHERVYVAVHGKPSAVLLATADLESLEETIEILADADTMRRLHASDAELARGEVETQSDLDAAMQRRRTNTGPRTRTATSWPSPPPRADPPSTCPKRSRQPPTSSSPGHCSTTPTRSASSSALLSTRRGPLGGRRLDREQ
jgi:prevent-host-death family protein